MSRKGKLLDAAEEEKELALEATLRPRNFEQFVGQKKITDNLRVFVQAARGRKEPLDHVLFCGPPGLGKTTLAHVIANEMGVEISSTSGPAVEKKGDLAGLLTNLKKNDVLFIDELHRLPRVVEENLYPAMEDFHFDYLVGEGPSARSLRLRLPPFTLIGATTRTALLSSPLRDRFGIVCRLDFYPPEELAQIVKRSAALLKIPIEEGAAVEIARRSRGTPRISNRLLRRVRDFAEVGGEEKITLERARSALDRLEVDAQGLDAMDRAVLKCIIEGFGGGPVGVEAIAASVAEERETIEDVYEPYLLQEGFVLRTPRGRMATEKAWRHLGLEPPPGQRSLL